MFCIMFLVLIQVFFFSKSLLSVIEARVMGKIGNFRFISFYFKLSLLSNCRIFKLII